MRIIFLGMGWFLFLITSYNRAQNVTPEMKTMFLSKLKTSITQKNYTLFSTLFCTDGKIDNPEMERIVEKTTHQTFDSLAANSVLIYWFFPIPSAQIDSFSRNGKNYEMNLKPIELIKIRILPTTSKTANVAVGTYTTYSFPLGVKDGNLLIARPVQKVEMRQSPQP